MTTIRLPQMAWYEPRELELYLPDNWQVEVCNIAGYNRPALSEDQIRDSITNMIDIAPIREAAKGKKEVVIIFDDITRVTRVAKIVPFVLEELAAAGIDDSNIRFIAATGSHGTMNRIDFVKKLGEATVARFPVYNHNPFENCTYVGTTSFGTEVYLNAEVMRCDFKIAIGSVTPYPAIFSGGGKIVLPGVSSIETILANHTLPMGAEYETMPRNIEKAEAAKFAGLDVIVQCMVNLWGDTVALFAGSPTSAHAAAIREARTHYLTKKVEDADITIANCYAKTENSIALRMTTAAVNQRGGEVVLISNSPGGQVAHYLYGRWGKDIWGRLKRRIPIPSHINHLIQFSEYPESAASMYPEESDRLLSMSNWDDVVRTLQEFQGDSAKVAVYPNAAIHRFG